MAASPSAAAASAVPRGAGSNALPCSTASTWKSTSTGAQGGPISVTKLQGPDYNLIRSTDPNFVGAYANYYVCNGAVIAPQFGDTRADAGAKATLQRLFPGRTVEQLDIDDLSAGGGGIHCVTQQQPVP